MIISQMLAFVFQIDILKSNYKVNAMVYIDFLLIFYYFLSTIYTVITKWSQLDIVLRSLCLEGLNIQLFVKTLTVIYYAKDLYELSKEISAVHNKSKGIYQDAMYVWAWRMNIVTKVQFVLYFFSALCFCLYPLYAYIIFNEKIVIYDLILPFDITTKEGYGMTIVIQIFLVYGTTVGVFVVDILFLLMVFNGAAYIDLLDCDCKMLANEIENSYNEMPCKKSTKTYEISMNEMFSTNFATHELLVNAIKRSQDSSKYFWKVCGIFEQGCLIQVYSCALTIILCGFVAKISNWFVVYLVVVSSIYQLSLYCVVGSLIEYKSEEIQKSVYNIPWHSMTIREQKMTKLLLQYVQNTITITMMGQRKLNVQTGCDVYKTIYSTYVMMEQFY